MAVEERIAELESQVQALTHRMDGLEARAGAHARVAQPRQAPSPQPVFGPSDSRDLPFAPRATPSRPTLPPLVLNPSRLLAAAGGLVLLLGIGYLLRYAVVQGWLTPEVRVGLALAASGVLAVVGMRLERATPTRIVGQVCTATASAGAYSAVVAAVLLYHLVPDTVGLLGAAGVAGAAIARGAWQRSPGVTALGVGGALASPVLVAASNGAVNLGLLVVALTAGLAVAVRRQWPAITALSFVLVTPQLWLIGMERAPARVGLMFTVICGGLVLAATIAHARGKDWSDVRVPTGVAVLNAILLTALGYAILAERAAGSGARPQVWLAAVAAVHLAAGVALCRRYFAPPMGVVLVAVGAALADAALNDIFHGYPLTVVLGLVALAAAAGVRVGWLADAARVVAGAQLIAVALNAVATTVPRPVTGSAEAVLLVAALCAAAVAFAALVADLDRRLAITGGAVLGGLALLRLLSVEAELEALLHGPADLPTAIVMCLALVGAGLLLGQLTHRWFTVAAVAIANYGVSLAAVALDPDGIGRVALTGLWAGAGGIALVAGRRLRQPELRRGGAALLAAAVTKAAVVDTTQLAGTNRAVALLLCGGVLVATAVAEARASGVPPRSLEV